MGPQQQEGSYQDWPVQPVKPAQKRRRAYCIIGTVCLVLAGAAAAVSAVLCATALSCTVVPLSMSLRSAARYQQDSSSQSSSAAAGPSADLTINRRGTTSNCPVQYASLTPAQAGVVDAANPPLLLGGAAAACTSGCQPRNTMWAESCKMDPESRTTWGLCEVQQRPRLLELAANMYNGSMLQFSPCDLYQLIKGRTLWLIGDSHMKSTYAAIRCLMLDFWNTTQGECAAASDPAEQLELHRAEMFTPRNLTLLDYTEPRCVHLVGGGRICFLHAVRGEVVVSGDAQKPGVLEFVQQRQLASSDDVFYVSTGRWYTHNCTGFEVPQYNQSLWNVAAHYKNTKAEWPHLFFGVPPFDHTTCNVTFNYKVEMACPTFESSMTLEVYDNISNYAHDVFDRVGLYIIDFMNTTKSLQWAHLGHDRSFRSAIDCLHYCRPGIPEMDVWFLYSAMQQMGIKAVSPSVVDTTTGSGTANGQTNLTCTRVRPFL